MATVDNFLENVYAHAHMHTSTGVHYHKLCINQSTDGDGNLLLVGVSEDDIGFYQCNNSVGELSVGYHLDVVGYSNSGQLGMCCYSIAK